MGQVSGKIILVTGATNGIGLESCVSLAREGATLIMIGRDPARTSKALAEVKLRSGSRDVSAMYCDFSSQAQIHRLAGEFRTKYDRLDVLVNNAGAIYPSRVLTEDGIEATFAVNHLGYFLLTHLLLDLIEKAGAGARIVNVASRAHYGASIDFENFSFEKGDFSALKAYSRSKLANVLFTRELARQLAGKAVTVNCLHPGVVATGIWANSPKYLKPFIGVIAKLFFISAEEGGRAITQLAMDPAVAATSGEYFSGLVPTKVSPIASNDAIAARLWSESLRLAKL